MINSSSDESLDVFAPTGTASSLTIFGYQSSPSEL